MILALSMIFTRFAPAQSSGCYQKYNQKLNDIEHDFDSRANAAAEVGVIGTPAGVLVAAVSTFGGAVTGGAITTTSAPAGVATAAGVTTTSVYLYQSKKIKKVMRLLAEAEVGQGLVLNAVHKKVERARPGISVDEVAQEIRDADKSGNFCLNEGTLLSAEDITNLLSAK